MEGKCNSIFLMKSILPNGYSIIQMAYKAGVKNLNLSVGLLA